MCKACHGPTLFLSRKRQLKQSKAIKARSGAAGTPAALMGYLDGSALAAWDWLSPVILRSAVHAVLPTVDEPAMEKDDRLESRPTLPISQFMGQASGLGPL